MVKELMTDLNQSLDFSILHAVFRNIMNESPLLWIPSIRCAITYHKNTFPLEMLMFKKIFAILFGPSPLILVALAPV